MRDFEVEKFEEPTEEYPGGLFRTTVNVDCRAIWINSSEHEYVNAGETFFTFTRPEITVLPYATDIRH